MLYSVALVSAVQLNESATRVHTSSSQTSLSRPAPSRPIPPIQVITELQAESSVLYGRFPLAMSVTALKHFLGLFSPHDNLCSGAILILQQRK